MADKKSESSLAHIKSKIKVVFLGDQSTGKTSILLRFMHDKFDQGMSATVGIDFMAKNYNAGNFALRLQLWDTAGQQRFRSLIPSYLKDATVTFIIFDITNKRSFQNLSEWIELCQQNRRQKSIIVLLGNKSDLEESRQIEKLLIQQKSKAQGLKYFEVSAKQNKNIEQAFRYAIQQYIKESKSVQLSQEPFSLNQLSSNSKNSKKQQAVISQISRNSKQVRLGDNGQKQRKREDKKNCC